MNAGPIVFFALVTSATAWSAAESARPAALPEILRAADGTPVRTVGQWEQQRRPEILELFRTHVYGRAPVDRPAQLSFSALERDVSAFGGKARRTTFDVVFGGPGGTGRFPLRIYAPPAGVRPKGIFLFIVNRGRPIIDEAETKPQPYWPVQLIVARGYVAAAFSNGDVAPDDKDDGFRTGVFPVFDPPGQQRAPDAWAAIGAWAWAASRAIDCLEAEPGFKNLPVAVVGHSRGGKTALWCGAQDPRVALTISNDSGSTGAALARTKRGETIAEINRAYPHWFATNYKNFNGREADLPVDQHMLVAAIAPRLVYIAAAFDNHRADPLAQFQAGREANPAYRLFGHTGLAAAAMPAADVPSHEGRIGYHAHSGLHYLAEIDWRLFMDFADRHLPALQASR